MSTRGVERLFLRTGGRQLIWPAPERGRSLFREGDPAVGLRGLVAKLRWGHEWIPPELEMRERIVPDGAVHLLFVFSNAAAGRPYGLVLGASSEPAVVPLGGRIEHLEIELRAGAVPALFGVPAGVLAGRAVALSDLWGDRAVVLQDRLLEVRAPEQRIAVVQSALARTLVERRSVTPPVIGEALRRIERGAGNLRVAELAAGLGVSARRMEQLFHAHVGLPPKSSCRLARLRGSLALLVGTGSAQRPPAWAEVALEGGYYDQSHLVNEFRALTGLAPGDFQRRTDFGFLQDPPGDDRYLVGRTRGSPAGSSRRRRNVQELV